MAEIKTYAGCSFGTEAAGTYSYTSVEGSWARTSQIWADGYNLYIFWGDVQGQITFYELETTAATATEATLAFANYEGAAVEFTLYQGVKEDDASSVCKIQGCYGFDLMSKKFKKIGDIFVIEGGSEYKIFYTPVVTP